MVLVVVVLQEWLCSCADIVPAAVSPMANHTDDGRRTAAAQNGAAHNGHPTPPASPPPTAAAANGELQPERLTPAALVAVHRVVLGLHTWALATDGGQPRATRGGGTDDGRGQHMQPPNNTNNTDEYHQSQAHHKTHSHKHQHRVDKRNGDHDEEDDNSQYTVRRPTSLEFATANNNVRRRAGTVFDIASALNNNTVDAPAAAQSAAALAKAKKRRAAPPKRAFGPAGQLLLVGIEEECEYDSDAGKFTCANAGGGAVEDSSDASSVVTTVSSASERTEFVVVESAGEEDEVEGNDMEAEEETTLSLSDIESELQLLGAVAADTADKLAVCLGSAEERKRSTMLCVGAFVLTCVLLFWFPLPE